MKKIVRGGGFFEDLSKRILPDRSYARILIEIGESEKTIEQAYEIIRDGQIEIEKVEFFEDSTGKGRAALVTLRSEDVQGIVLKFVENGFLRILGFKPVERY